VAQCSLELGLTSLRTSLVQALAAVGRVGVPSLGPHLEDLLHASGTEYPFVSDRLRD
jgi:hypothetical protein